MNTVYRVAGAAARIVRSRLFAASALAVVSAVFVGAVALNMNAVTVVAGDVSRVVLTLDENPHRALSSAGVTLNEGDEVLAASDGDVVRVNRAFDVMVVADGITTVLRMTDGTVADALERADVTLGEYDKLSAGADTPVSAGLARAKCWHYIAWCRQDMTIERHAIESEEDVYACMGRLLYAHAHLPIADARHFYGQTWGFESFCTFLSVNTDLTIEKDGEIYEQKGLDRDTLSGKNFIL